MYRPTCFCCGTPTIGVERRHRHSIEIRYGALQGVKQICDGCWIEVSRVIARLVAIRHTFEVSKNALISVEETMRARRLAAIVAAAPMACRVYGQSLV